MEGTLRRAAIVVAVSLCGISVMLSHAVPTQAADAFSPQYSATDRAEYERLVVADPANANAWLTLARIYTQQQLWEDAAVAYQRVTDLGPAGRDVRMEYGDALRALGKLEQAVEQYNLAVETSPVDDLLSRADQAYYGGRLTEAAELYQEALGEAPGNRAALLGLARVHLRPSTPV